VGPDETNGSVICGVSASRSDGVGLFPREMQKEQRRGPVTVAITVRLVSVVAGLFSLILYQFSLPLIHHDFNSRL
jgi:hypothetical protein